MTTNKAKLQRARQHIIIATLNNRTPAFPLNLNRHIAIQSKITRTKTTEIERAKVRDAPALRLLDGYLLLFGREGPGGETCCCCWMIWEKGEGCCDVG